MEARLALRLRLREPGTTAGPPAKGVHATTEQPRALCRAWASCSARARAPTKASTLASKDRVNEDGTLSSPLEIHR